MSTRAAGIDPAPPDGSGTSAACPLCGIIPDQSSGLCRSRQMSNFRSGIRLAVAFQYILGLIFLCAGFSVGAVTPEIRALDPAITDATLSEVTSGSLDAKF